MESLEEKIKRVVSEQVDIVPYNPEWPQRFAEEKAHLLACLPNDLIRRIEHFGSTAIPGLAAKPIVDMLVEVTSLEETKIRIAPVLEGQGYDYFWRPSWGDDTPPFYAWFIKRNTAGQRSHHIHMVEHDFEHWDRLYFRDFLIAKPELAMQYQRLKEQLSDKFKQDRVAYTQAKTDWIVATTRQAKAYYTGKTP